MNKITKKLRSQAGETLLETLFALLIASLSLAMLAGAIAASGNVVKKGRDNLNAYYSLNEASAGVVRMSESGTPDTVTITGTGLNSQTFNIEYYKNETFGTTPVVAYKYAP